MGLPIAAGEVRRAWAALTGLGRLTPLQVLARPDSPLGPPGWAGLLELDGTLTVVVPDSGQVEPVRTALAGLAPAEATRPEILGPRLAGPALVRGFALANDAPAAPWSAVLGPAALFYPLGPLRAGLAGDPRVGTARPDELYRLLLAADPAEVSESGLAEITESAFAVREDGRVVAACGWRRWPGGLANLAVLTHPAYRRRGLAALAAAAAIERLGADGLVPQWRARPVASQRLALSLGLTQLGSQLCVELTAESEHERRDDAATGTRG